MRSGLTRSKKLLLGLAVAVLALAIGFGVIEGGLRLAGYGHSGRFYREVRDEHGVRWWRENRWVTAPYFPPALIRRPQAFRLPVAKAPGTFRIFVLGSSAAMGDPEPAFSMARMLDVLLREAYPSIRFEVVNAGITAINSHVVRAIAADCAELQPDLFIVYEGNNEVIGPYGPGTVFSPFLRSDAAIRLTQAIKSTRTGQLLASAARRAGSKQNELRDWGGMQMFLRHEIAWDDPRLEATREAFRDNLGAIANSGRRAGASVFLCTVLTNQKDFAPFLSRHRAGLAEEEIRRGGELLAAGLRDFARGSDVDAEKDFRAALALDDHMAEAWFQLARVCLRQKRTTEAKEAWQRALDFDVLRFRTDSRLNDAIRTVARAAGDGVHLVDLVAAAERESADGILGDDFLYEHVHLNFQGTYHVARELFREVSAELERRHLISARIEQEKLVSLAEARRRLAYTTYEQAMIIKELRARFSGAPFTAQSDHAERERHYAQLDAAATRTLARPESRDGLAVLYEEAMAARPDDWMLRRNVGMAYVGLGLFERARPHLEQARAAIPDDPDTLFALGTAQRALGDAAAAEKTFAMLRALEPEYPGLNAEADAGRRRPAR